MSSDLRSEQPGPSGIERIPRSHGSRRLPTAVYVLSAVNACIGIGYGIAAPVIPVLATSFEVSNTAATMVVSLYAATRVVLAPVAARLALRVPTAVLMSCALVVTAVTSICAGLAESFLGLLLWRGLGGGGTAVTTVAGQAMLYRVAPRDALGRSSSLFHTGFLVGGILGPLIGGVLAGWHMEAPLVAYGLLLLVGAVIAATRLRSPNMATEAAGSAWRFVQHESMSIREAVTDLRYRVVLVVNFALAWIGNGLRFTILPLYVAVVLDRGPIWTGSGLLVAGVVQFALVMPAGRFTDRRSARLPLLIGCAMAVVAVLLMMPVFGIAGFLAAMAVLGMSSALTTPAASAVLGQVLAGRGGPPLAGYQMVFDVATIFAPLVCGLLSDQLGFSSAYGLSAVVGLCAFASVLFMPSPRQTAAAAARQAT